MLSVLIALGRKPVDLDLGASKAATLAGQIDHADTQVSLLGL